MTHRPHHRLHNVGRISYNSRSQMVFLQGKINNSRFIAHVVNPVLLSFIRQEGDVLFSRTTHIHIRLLLRNVLFVEYNCPGQQDPQIFRQMNMYVTWWSGNLLFLQSLPQPIPNCDIWCKMLGIIYRRITFDTFMTVFMREYTPALPPEGDTLCIDVCLGTPYCDMCV